MPDIKTVVSEARGPEILSAQEAVFLLQCYNEIFFGGENPLLAFTWEPLPYSRGKCVLKSKTKRKGKGRERETEYMAQIKLNDSTLGNRLHLRGHDLLSYISVLLHEATHAFLKTYSCPTCHSGKRLVDGHGRPFQLITQKLEEIFPKLLGLPVRLNRWEALKNNWAKTCEDMPSRHDLATWRCCNYFLECEDENDVSVLLDRTVALRQYRPGMGRRGFLQYP